MARKKSRSRFNAVYLLPIVALGCLAIFLFISLPGITNQAAKVFGEPSVALSAREKIHFSIIMLGSTDSLTQPANPLGVDMPFEVALGESPTDVSQRLEALLQATDRLRALPND